MVSEPTKNIATLGVLLTTHPQYVLDINICDQFCDHRIIFVNAAFAIQRFVKTIKKLRDYFLANTEDINRNVAQILADYTHLALAMKLGRSSKVNFKRCCPVTFPPFQ